MSNPIDPAAASVTLIDLWLPVLVSAIALFVASFLAWMVLPHHKGDWKKLPDEDAFFAALRKAGIEPGQYMYPWCDAKDMKQPEMKARWQRGPHGLVNVWPGVPPMARNLVVTFVFFVVVSIFVAYVTSAALSGRVDASYLHVFQIAGTCAIMAYAFGGVMNGVWFGKTLRNQVTDIADGVVYGLLTAGIMGWLWPG